ncbi:MAG TPA: hypothetical protein VLT88_04675 [Desulfosarcina sp.]|nr:hypothetical protein [Desulfosarcina sp.]
MNRLFRIIIAGSQPVAAQIGQLPLHGFVHEMDEARQGIIGAATRAAQDDGSSGTSQGQRPVAAFAGGLSVDHASPMMTGGTGAAGMASRLSMPSFETSAF